MPLVYTVRSHWCIQLEVISVHSSKPLAYTVRGHWCIQFETISVHSSKPSVYTVRNHYFNLQSSHKVVEFLCIIDRNMCSKDDTVRHNVTQQ